MNLWKTIGLAGLAGVAAAGVIIAREQRQRAQLTPDEVRARLHQRLEQASTPAPPDNMPDGSLTTTSNRRWFPRRRRQRSAGGQRSKVNDLSPLRCLLVRHAG